ncbi:tail fiber assembly protein [Serratia quinivorans]
MKCRRSILKFNPNVFFAAKDKNPHVEWNKYRMALNQMDVTTSSDVGWPVSL